MGLVTIIWSMIASACLTLAAINFLTWCKNRKASAYLLFSLLATSTAAFAFCELWMMRARTPAEFATVLKWGHVAVWVLVITLVGFVRVYLKAGRPWLAWTVCCLRTLALFLNFLTGQNLNYRAVTGLRHISFLGDSVQIPEAVPNPWMIVGQLSFVFLVIFAADASIMAWRRGDRHLALTVGGSTVFFTLVSAGQSLLVFWGIVRMPIVATLSFMGMVAAMGYELSGEAIRAVQLDRQLLESEAGLREIEERMTVAVEAANFGIWVRDLARDEIWATDQWRALFGFPAEERLEFDHILQRIHPDDRDGFRLTLEKAAQGNGSYQAEYRIVLPDGEECWIDSHGRFEFDVSGKPILLRGVSLNITARKEAERETQILRQEIAHVGRVSMMGQLASALAHEINQPLGAILRNAEAAELFMQDPSPDLDEVRAILADIRKDDQRAGSVIDRMRAMLKRHNPAKQTVDVGNLVGGVIALVRTDALVRHIKVASIVPANLPPVFGDPVHLQQVLLNLIVNAMDAIDGGNPEHKVVSVTVSFHRPRTIEIAVNDTGPGIPANALPHIFDPFFTTKPNGMGMGLAICRTIVEAHNGMLWAENRSEGGASFRLTLPAAKEGATK
jgi:two-component system, LuxR family, sensor kinase FixL